jgi:hypothetical protein
MATSASFPLVLKPDGDDNASTRERLNHLGHFFDQQAERDGSASRMGI